MAKRARRKYMSGPVLPDRSFYSMGRSASSIKSHKSHGKKARSPAQKAATERMLAANPRTRGKVHAKGVKRDSGWSKAVVKSAKSSKQRKVARRLGSGTSAEAAKKAGVSLSAWAHMTRRQHKDASKAARLSKGPKLKVGQSKVIKAKSNRRSGKHTQYQVTVKRVK